MELSSLQIRSEYQQSGSSQQLRDAASVILSCPLACITFKLQKRALQGKLFHHQHSGSHGVSRPQTIQFSCSHDHGLYNLNGS